jgi:hypothetical protein
MNLAALKQVPSLRPPRSLAGCELAAVLVLENGTSI